MTGKWLRRADGFLLDLLYPPRCPICDSVVLPGEGICTACKKKVRPAVQPVCMKCGKPLSDGRKEYCRDCSRKKHAFIRGNALWVYENEVKSSIYRFKYQDRREYAKVYAWEIAKQHGKFMKSRGIGVIVPVPLHKKRKRRRGYNQAELLAKELGKLLGLPVRTDLLVRVRDTKPQKTLNDTERKNNLKEAFKTTENIVQLQYVLVVDDIYTTGSTLDAAASALIQAGAAGVYTCCIGIGCDS